MLYIQFGSVGLVRPLSHPKFISIYSFILPCIFHVPNLIFYLPMSLSFGSVLVSRRIIENFYKCWGTLLLYPATAVSKLLDPPCTYICCYIFTSNTWHIVYSIKWKLRIHMLLLIFSGLWTPTFIILGLELTDCLRNVTTLTDNTKMLKS